MQNHITEVYEQMGISKEVLMLCQEIEESLKERFDEMDKVTECNQLKVLAAMQKHQISEAHLGPTTGYGYNDMGREALEKVYADIFGTEAALVRAQITCGTHALALALSSN